ncbi:MAG: PQQ-dependent sugar dehydrogenase [Halomonas sp.]|nr:PQQ-dependent sugar dehydrogenase [Halomonas sp.]
MDMRACLLSKATAIAVLMAPLALAQPDSSIRTQAGAVRVEVLAEGLVHPWGMAFLPDGRLLVTERTGRLRILEQDNTLTPPLDGVPEVFDKGQGGLLDVALDPQFASNRLVYLSFAEAGEGGASTALGRGRLEGRRLVDFEVIFRQRPKVPGPNHFGGRIVFTGQGTLFLTLGERFKFEPAQDLPNHLGKIVRLNHDGSIPADNPFVNQANAEGAIWSYGHRNVESAAIHPETGQLWIAEMGPLGGDELNLPKPGRNYGWPVVSWGMHYGGEDIPDPPTHPNFADALVHWTPVISPSGMDFYTGDAFEAWQGSALIGGLSSQAVIRLENNGIEVTDEERIPMGVRIRDVEEGPNGYVYLLTDERDGRIMRLVPLQ